MSTSAARQPKGVPVGGQFAAAAHAEPSLHLTPDPEAAPTQPARPYELTDNGDGTFTYNAAGAATVLKHRQPVTRTEIPRAVRCTRSRGRIVDLSRVPGRRNSPWDDVYEVAGPDSGAPLVIRIQEGFHRLHVESGNVHIEVLKSFGGGTVVEKGASANVVVDGTSEYSIETRGTATAQVALSLEAKVEIRAAGKGTMHVTGGGPGCEISAKEGATVHQDGNELSHLPVPRPKVWY